jgi:hypothetical protein
MNLLSPLAIRDTSLFTRYDTVRNDIHVRDSANCYLPHIAPMGANGIPIGTDNFIILKNSSNRYILARFEPVWAIDTDYTPMPTFHTYHKGYIVRWFLQTDGTLNFGDITGIRWLAPQNRAITEERANMKEILQAMYNIKGQRMAADYHGVRKATGVMLIKNASGVTRVFTYGQAR